MFESTPPAAKDLGTFRAAYELEWLRHKEWREGQTAFNFLNAMRPELADQIRNDPTGIDPFYVDANLPAFFAWLEEHWETRTPRT
jgi:hypothetical protein